MVRFKPIGQAAKVSVCNGAPWLWHHACRFRGHLQGDILRKGDSVWRINNTVVTGCSFRDIINILASVPRPFVVDFVRPEQHIDFGHTTVFNHIQFDMVRVDAGDEAKVMPAAKLKSVASMGQIKFQQTKVRHGQPHAKMHGRNVCFLCQSFANLLKMRSGRIVPSPRQESSRPPAHASPEGRRYTPSPARSFHKTGSSTKMRRIALPPMNRMALNAKQEQWGIPVYSVEDDEDGHGVPIGGFKRHLPKDVGRDGRRMSVAM